MNTIPHLQPLIRRFAENFGHDVETAEIGENAFPGPDFAGARFASALLIVAYRALGLAKLDGKLALGKPLGEPIFREILAKHTHIT